MSYRTDTASFYAETPISASGIGWQVWRLALGAGFYYVVIDRREGATRRIYSKNSFTTAAKADTAARAFVRRMENR